MFVAKFQTSCKQCHKLIIPGQMASKVAGLGTVHMNCSKTAKPLVAGKPGLASFKAKVHADLVAAVAAHTPEPLTQKARGIRVLQSHGILSQAMAYIGTSLESSILAAQHVGLPCFCRPCPITSRHGFVDSRTVSSEDEVRQVWNEARAADSQAELILMPFVQSSHNMVWRPGLLSIGPGHDGATGGHDSLEVYLQPAYSQTWQQLATAAGCDLEKCDPFVEAVSGPAQSLVVTQVRAGTKGAPTAPNWVPADMTVGEVVVIDPAHKKDAGKMLEWESTAKTLQPGYHVVYNPGGNGGDHWFVHSQAAGIAVVTNYLPTVGEHLPKQGIDLVPLDPQAIAWGFLGGILSPSLLTPVRREQAVCAAVMGTHHGLLMGGDAGVHLGASVAMMLRLGQAAIWGEARHKDGKGLSREQIYAGSLDHWLHGRSKLRDKVALFFEKSWFGEYGGPAWAACGQATVQLDTAMLTVIQQPTIANATALFTCLTNVVNLAHNNGWWLNKFAHGHWFDYAADLDPRVAFMAGPIWYEATTAPADLRMRLLAKVQGLSPIDLGPLVKTWGDMLSTKAKVKKPGKPSGLTSESTKSGPKLGGFGPTVIGGTITLPFVPTQALHKGDHLQIGNAAGQYISGEMIGDWGMAGSHMVKSLSGSGATYLSLDVIAAQHKGLVQTDYGKLIVKLTW